MTSTNSQEKSVVTIGLFDSGVGGLSVLNHLSNSLQALHNSKKYRLIYLGDTARCPYGNREPQEIASFVSQITNWLLAHQGAESIVMACNTSAALAGHFARAHINVPVYDVISPTAKYIAQNSLNVAVLATQSTIKSGAYSRSIKELNASLFVQEIACPELTPLVEQGLTEDQRTLDVLQKHVNEINLEKIQAVVLGCTHYSFLSKLLKKILPSQLQIIDPAIHLVNKLITNESAALNQHAAGATVFERFYTTGAADQFAKTASICLNRDIGTVYGISLSELLNIVPVSQLVPGITKSINSIKAIP